MENAVRDALEALRHQGPLVMCQTNDVVTGFTANVLLAVGASPAMVDDVQDAQVFAAVADGLLVNVGTLASERTAAMRAAVAARGALPWVLDPVAAGPLPARTALARELLAAGPTVVRANASEVLGLAGSMSAARGVDAGDGPEAALPAARELGCVVAISGPVDVITDGSSVVRVGGGHLLMTQVTGVGCALGALVAATAAVAEPLVAAVAATALMNAAGTRAARDEPGTGTFAVRLLDELSTLTPDRVLAAVDLT